MIGVKGFKYAVLARTTNPNLLNSLIHRKVDRFYFGVYLPEAPEGENLFDVPSEWNREGGAYLEMSFPVDDNIVVCAVDRYGRELVPTPDKNEISGLREQSFIARDRMAIMVMKKEQSVAVSTLRVLEIKENITGKFFVESTRLYQWKVPLSSNGEVVPENFFISESQPLGDILFNFLVDASNTLNKLRAANKTPEKRVISLGIMA